MGIYTYIDLFKHKYENVKILLKQNDCPFFLFCFNYLFKLIVTNHLASFIVGI